MGVPAAQVDVQMKCWMCGEARKFSAESVYCVMYGIIISRTHNCDRKGARLRGPDDERDGDGNDETGLYEDGGGDLVRLPGMVFRAGE